MLRLRAALALLVVALACSARAEELLRLSYGSESLQVGDLRLPKGDGPFPLAIVIHGGCWLSGSASLDSTEALAIALRDAGLATWNVEYRRVGDSGGGWPGTFRDVGAAVDFARTLAKSHPIDLSRVVVVGHSAGAHLALWSAARAKLPKDSEIQSDSPLALRGVVALAGPGDLRTLADGSVCGGNTLEELLGGSLAAKPEHWAQASPAALVPLGVTQTLVVGGDDRVVRPRLVAAYERVARAAGDTVKLVEIPGANHIDVIVPSSRAWKAVEESVLALAR